VAIIPQLSGQSRGHIVFFFSVISIFPIFPVNLFKSPIAESVFPRFVSFPVCYGQPFEPALPFTWICEHKFRIYI
jgi:hypothetical protein